MQIEIAKHARMSERGSSLLRLIQNNDMPILDLLVRESIQNSLDASLSGNGYINVDFNVKSFNSLELSAELEGISESLNKRFLEEKQQLLEIRDTNTSGLTGPIRYEDVKNNQFGNLLKLIYEISMPQQQEGAGGSWGLGKTVYFRVGIGLVIYYSQIKTENGDYASRMAACLVENESDPNALIKTEDDSLKRGIAWWGQGIGDGTTIALTNDEEILKILKLLNIHPFNVGETGTSIIIPYINIDSLLEGILPSNGNEDNKEFSNIWWMDKITDYIMVAVQRWYAPRLMNRDYSFGRWLRVRVDGTGIKNADMLPIFRIVQGLYNATPISKKENEYEVLLENSKVFCEEISLRNIFTQNSCAGYISYVKVTREELLMNYPYNHQAPYTYINKFDTESGINNPIIMYTRKPGMIVGYENSGYWTDAIPKTTDGEFIIGLFVANSFNILKQTNHEMTVEEYIRKSEKADHTTWNDWNIGIYKPYIVSKIQNQVSNKLAKKFMIKNNENAVRRNIGLGKAIAEVLLPPENFGRKSSSAHGGLSGKDSMNKSKGYGVRVVSAPKYSGRDISLDFEIACGKQADKFSLEIILKTETGTITADKWESEDGIGKEFPIMIKKVEFDKYKTGKQAPPYKPRDMFVDSSNRVCESNGIEVKINETKSFKIDYGIVIDIPEKTGYDLFGTIIFEVLDAQVQAGLNLYEIGGEQQ